MDSSAFFSLDYEDSTFFLSELTNSPISLRMFTHLLTMSAFNVEETSTISDIRSSKILSKPFGKLRSLWAASLTKQTLREFVKLSLEIVDCLA